MIDKSTLTKVIENLEVELRKSGKSETADFFSKIIITVNMETDQNVLREIFNQLCSSGSMAQYANFSYSEEVLFENVFEEAKKLLAEITSP